jgi:hypothetical protein
MWCEVGGLVVADPPIDRLAFPTNRPTRISRLSRYAAMGSTGVASLHRCCREVGSPAKVRRGSQR